MVGIIVTAGSGFEIGKLAQMGTPQYQVALAAFLTGGIGMLAACFLSLTESIISMFAAKRMKKKEYKKEFRVASSSKLKFT